MTTSGSLNPAASGTPPAVPLPSTGFDGPTHRVEGTSSGETAHASAYAPGAEARSRDLQAFTESCDRMISLVKAALAAPKSGENLAPDENAWNVVRDFDRRRLAGGYGSPRMPELDRIAADAGHPCCADAELLKDILERPGGCNAPSLDDYLAGKLEPKLCLGRWRIPPNPDSQTFNSILPLLATGTVDHGSVGRTLLFKGLERLIGLQPGDAHADRRRRLQVTMFSFPRIP